MCKCTKDGFYFFVSTMTKDDFLVKQLIFYLLSNAMNKRSLNYILRNTMFYHPYYKT